MTRAYHSPLRAEQTEQTRDRIVAKVIEILADPETRDLTIPEVARRAGISVRTAYRHFPTKEALYDAVNEWWGITRVTGGPPKHVDEYPEYLRRLFQSFGETEALIRARRNSKPLQEAHTRRKAYQRKVLGEAFAPLTAGLDPAEARRIVAVIHAVGGSETYLAMRDHWELSPEEAGEAMKWAMEAIIDRLRRRRSNNKPVR